jgi:uncharacterized membrane protein
MTTLTRALLLATLLTSALSFAQGTYTQIDYPGSIETDLTGINNTGSVTGIYQDTTGEWHGFLLSDGNYTAINYPGANGSTYVYGINDKNQIVGQTASTGVGFEYDVASQVFTQINCGLDTVPISINNSGVIVGIVIPGYIVGFELSGSTCTTIEPPRGENQETYVESISRSGEVDGYIRTTQGHLIGNFLYRDGKYLRVVIPGEPTATVGGLSPDGSAVVGSYAPSTGVTMGFIYQNGTVSTLQFPGAAYTNAGTINGAGEVVGTFSETGAVTHGFTWTPDAPAQKNDTPRSGARQ